MCTYVEETTGIRTLFLSAIKSNKLNIRLLLKMFLIPSLD